MSLRDKILAAEDTVLTPVEVPEWACTVYLKRLNVGERIPLLDALERKGDENKIVGVLCLIYCVVDEDGKPVFGYDDYDALMNKAGDVVLRLGGRAAKLNKLFDEEPVAEAKKEQDVIPS